MIRYVIPRLILMIPVIIGVTLLIFLLQAFTPGDPAKLTLGNDSTEEEREQWREERDLNDPILVQYVKYMWNVMHGDFGISYRSPKNITTTIFERWPTTFLVAMLSVSISAFIGITFCNRCVVFLVLLENREPVGRDCLAYSAEPDRPLLKAR